jgi:hypothetical protein
VAVPALTASVVWNRTSGPHPFSVAVTANVSGGTPPFQYLWTFGDGGTASTAGAIHVYDSRGTYQILLRVTDRENRTASAGAAVTVLPVTEHVTVLNASDQTLGAGPSKAWIVPITVPSTELSTWVYGTTNVTGCSLSGNCAAFVEVLNVHDETNLTLGNAVTNPIWCHAVNGSCEGNRTLNLSIDLGNYPGETLYLVVFNTDVLWSQSVSALVWMSSSY